MVDEVKDKEWGKRNKCNYKMGPKTSDLCGDGIVLYLYYIKVNILVVILYSFAIYYHLEKLSKNLSVLFLKTTCKPIII